MLIGVVAQPIIEEFRLQDWQFGLLSGFGFALMYTLMGIPIGRLSKRYIRVRIVAVSVILWSGMIALCGIANGFLALLVFSIDVGIGEAGCTPPANSLIADYFPPRSRARALATYSMGITIGGVLANAFGGPVADMFSWREAFLVLGIPGVVIGLALLFVIREPPRGYADPPGTPEVERLGFRETVAEPASKRTFWLNVYAAALVAFVGYGMINFQAAFFQRVHGLSADSRGVALGLLLVASVLHYSYLGAQYTICQGVASTRARATAVALFLFIVNLIGYGLGRLWVGATE
ncbi:MFS transporter [Seongchinamella sediminis]|uniref:MFS transporter n=1 Tax=Seongchinamella sediminis TaxID=2283635 RepID=UPI001EF05F82|nr:MFS transporter [Seongchinamella sediminis]